MIWWHGKSSDDVNVIVERYPNVILPVRKQEKVSVPGRNGDLVMEQDAYENVVQRYEIYVSAEKPRLTTIAHVVAEWLMVKGYQRLEDSYFLDTYRLGMFTGGIEIENVLNRFGRATIEFDCKPQRFYKHGEFPVDLSNGQVLFNPSPFAALPLLVIQGSGAGTISDGTRTLSLSNCNNVTVDCDIKQIYQGTVNRNNYGSGSFLKLAGSQTTITWTGGITGVKLTPRWWTL